MAVTGTNPQINKHLPFKQIEKLEIMQQYIHFNISK
jgi:hypothetical protein